MPIKRIFQFIGVVNVLFIILNSSYQFGSAYFSNVTALIILIGLVILSFAKEIFEYTGVEVPYKPLQQFFQFTSLLVSGILSSFVLLIPKLLFMESHKLDSMMVKFTVKITRLWSREELSICLDELIYYKGVRDLISNQDRIEILDNSYTMSELKTCLNLFVDFRLEDISDRAAEVQTVVQQQDSLWTPENAFFIVTVSVITVAVIASVGYLLYVNYGSSSPSAPVEDFSPESLDDWEPALLADGTIDFSSEVARLHTLFEVARNGSDEGLVQLSILAEKLDGLFEKIEDLEVSVEGNSMDIGSCKELMDALRADIDTVKLTADQALQKTIELSALKEQAADILGASRAAAQGGFVDPVSALAKNVDSSITGVKSKFYALETEVGFFKTASLKAYDTFTKDILLLCKNNILQVEELEALKTLLGTDTIRKILIEQAEDIVKEKTKK